MNNSSKSLLPPNATKLLNDLEQSSSKILELEAKNKEVFNPNLVSTNILPWLAWGFSIDAWDDNWSDEIKREMIKNTISLHRIKGTKKAVQKALEIIGIFAQIIEWWETDPKMAVHTFHVIAYLNDNLNKNSEIIIDLNTQKRLIDLIENVKPARSHFSLKLGVRFKSNASYTAILRTKQFTNFIFCTKPTSPKPVLFQSSYLALSKLKLSSLQTISLNA